MRIVIEQAWFRDQVTGAWSGSNDDHTLDGTVDFIEYDLAGGMAVWSRDGIYDEDAEPDQRYYIDFDVIGERVVVYDLTIVDEILGDNYTIAGHRATVLSDTAEERNAAIEP